ncbi:IclR family transcriptional regulator [Pseudomonas ogarae]|uniref:HTH-type transcriptional repressor AllR n=1 Tax=Pseudomonas ogarae (strain DSM 112162 / CECT 30235 / F113) TaxID=1114970 RepID=A0ABN5G9M8_PSEO1|nr:IclR family transcriptional regulator [Pseudomonas ogarae]AUO47306.1 transcriptional regulator [Pseudomonas ogarae]
MSSLNKMLSILDFFSIEKSTWSPDELIAEAGLSRPTGYRYLKELCDSGLLRRAQSGYSLGPRIVEMDYYIRQSDRLLISCRPVMNRLAQETGCDILLASIYGVRILAVHQEQGELSSPVAYGRGRPMPLFRGGGSKVILAALSPARQKRLYASHTAEITEAGLGQTWKAFRAHMLKIQQDGHVISVGELDSNAAGVAVPLYSGTSLEPAALILVTTRSRFALVDQARLIELLKNSARQIEIADSINH